MIDAIREHSPVFANQRIDRRTLADLERFRNAPKEEIHRALKRLDRCPDIESYVEVGTALATVIGLALSRRDRRWLLLPAAMQAILLAHGLRRPEPLTPLLRAFGVWSRGEIAREKQALKLLRGDYRRVDRDPTPKGALAAAQGEVGLAEGSGALYPHPLRHSWIARTGRRAVRALRGPSRRRSGTARPEGETIVPMGEDLRPMRSPGPSGRSGHYPPR